MQKPFGAKSMDIVWLWEAFGAVIIFWTIAVPDTFT
jgi:hypothetical protein